MRYAAAVLVGCCAYLATGDVSADDKKPLNVLMTLGGTGPRIRAGVTYVVVSVVSSVSMSSTSAMASIVAPRAGAPCRSTPGVRPDQSR